MLEADYRLLTGEGGRGAWKITERRLRKTRKMMINTKTTNTQTLTDMIFI